jgi:hypothetical protein
MVCSETALLFNTKKRDHLEDGVEGSIMLKRILKEVWFEDVDWIYLAQDIDLW